jgi:hypothetical protein
MAFNASRYSRRPGTLRQLAAIAVAALGLVTHAAATTFTVNSVVDIPDSNPGNGVCETASATVSAHCAPPCRKPMRTREPT